MTLTDTDRQRLVALLGMLGSEHAGERAAAAFQVEEFRKRHNLTWAELLAIQSPAKPPPPPPYNPPPPQPRPQPKPQFAEPQFVNTPRPWWRRRHRVVLGVIYQNGKPVIYRNGKFVPHPDLRVSAINWQAVKDILPIVSWSILAWAIIIVGLPLALGWLSYLVGAG